MGSGGSVGQIKLLCHSQRFLLFLSIPYFPTVNSKRIKGWGSGKWKEVAITHLKGNLVQFPPYAEEKNEGKRVYAPQTHKQQREFQGLSFSFYILFSQLRQIQTDMGIEVYQLHQKLNIYFLRQFRTFECYVLYAKTLYLRKLNIKYCQQNTKSSVFPPFNTYHFKTISLNFVSFPNHSYLALRFDDRHQKIEKDLPLQGAVHF